MFTHLFSRRSKKTSKLRVTGLCGGNSPGTGEFPAQMTSNAENVSPRWRHHAIFHIKADTNSLLIPCSIVPVRVVMEVCAHCSRWGICVSHSLLIGHMYASYYLWLQSLWRFRSYWRNPMSTYSNGSFMITSWYGHTLLALCARNLHVTGGLPTKMISMRGCDAFVVSLSNLRISRIVGNFWRYDVHVTSL